MVHNVFQGQFEVAEHIFDIIFHISRTFRLPTARKSHEDGKNGFFLVILSDRGLIEQNGQK